MIVKLKSDIYLNDGINEVTLKKGESYKIIRNGVGGGWPTLIDNDGEEFDVAIEDEEFEEFFEEVK